MVFNILFFISPSFAKNQILKLGEKFQMTSNTKIKFEDWGPTFKSVEFLRSALSGALLSLGQEAFAGEEAPDAPVVTMDGERTSIRRFIKGAFR